MRRIEDAYGVPSPHPLTVWGLRVEREYLDWPRASAGRVHDFGRELYLLLPLSIEAETEAAAEAEAEPTADAEVFFSARWPNQTGAAVNRLAC